MKFDLHIHSTYSGDAENTLKDISREIERKKIDGFAVVDHNSLEGYNKIKNLDTDLIIVPGVEVSAPEGHILALGLQEEIGRQESVKEAIDVIREHGAIAVAAHPYRLWSGIGEKVTIENDWDAIEGINGRSWRIRNLQAQKLAEELRLPIIGGSDSHRPKTIGKTYTTVDNAFGWEDVIESIKKGKTGVGGDHRYLIQTFFYVRRAVWGWIKRGGQSI